MPERWRKAWRESEDAMLLLNDLPWLVHPEPLGSCNRPTAAVGWWCARRDRHTGPCALRPRRWNLLGRWMSR